MQSLKARNSRRLLFSLVATLLFRTYTIKFLNLFVNYFQLKEQHKATFPFLVKRRTRNLQILVYHRINDENDLFFPATPIKIFERQMDYLAHNFNVCDLETAVDRLRRADVPENAVVVTFDDGYRDNYLNAFPILKHFSIPATIFLATDAIDTGKVLWHDRIFGAFRKTQKAFLDMPGRMARRYSLTTSAEKLVAQNEVLGLLRVLGGRDRLRVIDEVVSKLGVSEDSAAGEDLMLTWDQIRAMQKSGIAFGSHTVTHPILSVLSVEEARAEIQQSKSIIEKELGTPISSFAYPNGSKKDYSDEIVEIVQEAGYSCAVTTIFGTNDSARQLFELRRATPWDEDIFCFGLRLNCYKLCA